jgi:hypothetical protein
VVDSGRERPDDVHEAWLIRDLEPEAAQIVSERWTACGLRDLDQEPEGMKKGGVG